MNSLKIVLTRLFYNNFRRFPERFWIPYVPETLSAFLEQVLIGAAANPRLLVLGMYNLLQSHTTRIRKVKLFSRVVRHFVHFLNNIYL